MDSDIAGDSLDSLMMIEQVAQLMSVSIRTVYNRLSAGDGSFPEPVRIPHSKRLFWRERDIAFWIEAHARQSQVTLVLQKTPEGWTGRLRRGDKEYPVFRAPTMSALTQQVEELCQ